ncbi:hypothetical protein HG530_006071 [Fusarium avenaceum]|nr:hypothetical protein HG530_006071 [Fusarium avenaceum]
MPPTLALSLNIIVRITAVLRAIHMPSKDIKLNIFDLFSELFCHRATEINTLRPLIALRPSEEDANGNKDNTPFPVDGTVHKDHAVNHRYIKRWWYKNSASRDGPEEERVLPKALRPCLEATTFFEDLGKERSAEVDELPGK